MSKPNLWQRGKSVLAGGMRQRVTRTGLTFTAASLMVGLAAFASANNLLFLLLAAMLSTLLVSGFVSRLGLAGLELDFSLPEHVAARQRLRARVLVRNHKRWIPSFSIHLAGSPGSAFASPLYFPVIPARTTLEEIVEISFSRRGIHHENLFQFATRFPFGFTERRVQVSRSRKFLVYPALDPQPGFEELLAGLSGEMEAHLRGRGHDFYRIRPYQSFESARHVDWKATAHTGDLQVREFAREEEHLLEIILDLNVDNEHLDWFEKAVEFCAFLSWSILRRGVRVRLRTQEFDLLSPEQGDIYTILKYLALVSSSEGKPPVPSGNDHSYAIVFSMSPERMGEAGWTGARLLGPGSMAAGVEGADNPDGGRSGAG